MLRVVQQKVLYIFIVQARRYVLGTLCVDVINSGSIKPYGTDDEGRNQE